MYKFIICGSLFYFGFEWQIFISNHKYRLREPNADFESQTQTSSASVCICGNIEFIAALGLTLISKRRLRVPQSAFVVTLSLLSFSIWLRFSKSTSLYAIANSGNFAYSPLIKASFFFLLQP